MTGSLASLLLISLPATVFLAITFRVKLDLVSRSTGLIADSTPEVGSIKKVLRGSCESSPSPNSSS